MTPEKSTMQSYRQRFNQARMDHPVLDAILFFAKCMIAGAVVAVAARALWGCGGAPFDAISQEPIVIDAAPDAGGDSIIVVTPEAGEASSEAEACTLVAHTNGIGQSWSDCAPLGTYNQTEAEQACEANAHLHGAASACVVNDCDGPVAVAVCDVDVDVLGFCTCWTFAGPAAGRVLSHACDVDAGAAKAQCAGPSNDAWQ
jgi:hypothetical protein